MYNEKNGSGDISIPLLVMLTYPMNTLPVNTRSQISWYIPNKKGTIRIVNKMSLSEHPYTFIENSSFP